MGDPRYLVTGMVDELERIETNNWRYRRFVQSRLLPHHSEPGHIVVSGTLPGTQAAMHGVLPVSKVAATILSNPRIYLHSTCA